MTKSTSRAKSATAQFQPVNEEYFRENYEINPKGQVRRVETGAILKAGRPGKSEFVVLTFNGSRKAFSVKTLLKNTFGELPLSRDERNKQIRRALKADGATTKSVAEQFKVSIDTVRKAAKETK